MIIKIDYGQKRVELFEANRFSLTKGTDDLGNFAIINCGDHNERIEISCVIYIMQDGKTVDKYFIEMNNN